VSLPAQKVLILDLSVDPEMYRPTAHWRLLLGNTSSHSVALLRGETIPPLDGFTHLIVTGSEASILEEAPWFEPAETTIRAAVERAMPVLGSCFGHQLMVRALHGAAHVRRSARPELGWFPVEVSGLDPDGPVQSESPVWMFCCHFDEVCDLDAQYQVLAHTDDCAVHAYRLGDASVWGVQGHPEIPPDEGTELLRAFAAQKPELADAVEQALMSPPRDDGFGAVLTRRFLECG
jgi:GMP synthase-like glutamine amidotransferase